MQKIRFVQEFRATATRLNGYRTAGDWMRLAEALKPSGIELTAADAARWADLNYLPGEAAPLIADGVTPETADEMDQLADDIAGGPELRAMQRIDDLVADGILIDPRRVHTRVDPDNPDHIIVDIDPE